ncbi:hypothetical protein CI109_102578 [Kwoniella shandongensis]|uniref:Uncharacterized protein n=1 Tax=Kwoniella shandongensis TaxID=1734106 RepID=A0A5M6BSJ2_9TREE|nr:uncharacterized protein CI109_005805 [Kwoniella shandongensis]KAA5525783.1 hypothetical protein CI109_005805 [Kwoniella shandongensis]
MSILAQPLRTCSRCASSIIRPAAIAAAGPSRIRVFSTSRPQLDNQTNLDTSVRHAESGDKPKINTWFLNTPSSSTSSASQTVRQPKFTAYDPSTTTSSTPSSSQLDAAPLPPTAPPSLQPLYDYLTSSTSESSEVVLSHTVQFFDTRLYVSTLQERGEGEVIRTPDEVGGNWEWVVVVQVKGRGRGVVARADGMIRRWLLHNPLSPDQPRLTTPNPKTPRIDPDSDWSIIPIKGTRVCINLLTEEGKDRWRLEEVWSGK